jgi:pimeloyl-ACP methyl ester carboxylesterase
LLKHLYYPESRLQISGEKEQNMDSVTSKDGTIITYDRMGQGAPAILVSGASVDRQANLPLAEALKQHFTIFNYDRRGRGTSGDTPPYAVEREIEDIDAVIGAAGGSAFLCGFSSGAALAVQAAASGLAIRKLALWEPPYILDGSRPRPPADSVKTLNDLVAAGRRGDAAEYFMAKIVGMPPEVVADARKQPWWPAQEALAHTLAYDATILGDYSLPTASAARIKTTTLVMAGGADFPWMRETAQALAEQIPGAKTHFLDGQGHNVDPAVIAPVLVEFFAS